MALLYTEEDLQRALDSVANGAGIRETSLNYSILRFTL
jgi:hypothetical protein